MINTAILLMLALFFACKVDPVEDAIIAQLETVGGIRMDLNTRILELEALPPVTCADSLVVAREQLQRIEQHVDSTYAILAQVHSSRTRDEIRRMYVSEAAEVKMAKYAANPDSVLLQPYRAKIRQRIGGLKTEFERVLYLPPGK